MSKKLTVASNKSKEKTKQVISKSTPKWFYLVMVLIPIFFIVFLEVFLRLINYGNDYTLFVPISKRFPEKLYINPNINKKYFNNVSHPPLPLPDAIDAVKKTNSFRIFVLGASSAEGYPFVPNASFPRNLMRRLNLLYPDKEIEVMNLGMSAINSYTLRDFTPSIIHQNPDLVLIYAGHNEYYGALGIGSSSAFTPSRNLTNIYVWLQDFKTTQLISKIIYGITHLFEPAKSLNDNNTLMQKMIGKSSIPLNSKIYNEGLAQFEGNLNDILEMFYNANIPVILGTLTSNIKDIPPFISQNEIDLPAAESIYNQAVISLSKNNLSLAKQQFIEAKDLDELRFRAPSQVNKILTGLAQKYNFPIVNVDSVFESESPDNIVGNSLMVDHLHPNLTGYKLLAKAFFIGMRKNKLLPPGSLNFSIDEQDSILNNNFPFTGLDSALSKIEIERLKNNYPFVKNRSSNYLVKDYQPHNFIDSVAKATMLKEMTWEQAHAKIAQWYWVKGDIKNFLNEMNVIIAERPYDDEPYNYLITKLIANNLFNEALPFLEKLNKLKSSAFTTKWLGQISLSNNNFDKAVSYLTKSLQFRKDDPQVWYNLAGAYFNLNQLNNTVDALKNCLLISPDYKPAIAFYNRIKSEIK